MSSNLWAPFSLDTLRARLTGYPRPWYIIGGWALDLWLGQQSRPHGDLEICVPQTDIAATLDHLRPLRFYTAQAGTLTPCTAQTAAESGARQFWGYDTQARAFRIDVMTEAGTPDTWVYKRNPQVTMPRADAVRQSQSGLSYLTPEVVLLFKAKVLRDKDQRDFETVNPTLTHVQRTWLTQAIAPDHPHHPWLAVL